jgi:hypothetical protein
MPVDHLNIVERKLIDNLRNGTYNTAAGTANAWTGGGGVPQLVTLQYLGNFQPQMR